ncbi:hypothetical protein [Deefgea piscis]|uniref:hypothetical protein n=1 Tax=Deefgea piscis TaxID=2739061 RepID=UPI001C812292|nr:hypothetical protein [Deefgea piscis]QZA80839.1 hypothetical protein K4H25_15305 [Deefgea piscis]
MSISAIAAEFRIREARDIEATLLMLEDRGLQKLIAVWPNVEINIVNEPEDKEWKSLWACVAYSEADIADLTGLDLGPIKVLLRRAIALHLIYPDGSVHVFAKTALQQRIKDLLGVKK